MCHLVIITSKLINYGGITIDIVFVVFKECRNFHFLSIKMKKRELGKFFRDSTYEILNELLSLVNEHE